MAISVVIRYPKFEVLVYFRSATCQDVATSAMEHIYEIARIIFGWEPICNFGICGVARPLSVHRTIGQLTAAGGSLAMFDLELNLQ